MASGDERDRAIRRRVISLAAAALLSLVAAGCGAGGRAGEPLAVDSSPAYVSAPPTPEQRLVEEGARLVVQDGCSACHLASRRQHAAPSFGSFAGHRVALRGGRRVLINEHLVIAALSHPGSLAMRGYDPRSMIQTISRLSLPEKPREVAALAAFIEQVGPETR